MDITNGLTLRKAVKDKRTPLRRFLEDRFAHARPLQQEYQQKSGELVVGSRGAHPGTAKTAMDLAVRFMLDPAGVPHSARTLFRGNKTYTDTVDELSAMAGTAARGGAAGHETFARAIWALALCVNAHRAGQYVPSVVFDLLRDDSFNVEAMIGQASSDAVAELAALCSLAERNLIPFLERPFHLGPEFDASRRTGLADTRLIAAEADLVCNGLLLDIKTRLGPKNPRTGIHRDGLARDDLYQLVAYALLDHSDTYAINSLGLYSARYGTLAVWPLEHVLALLAGEPVDLPEVREQMWEMLHA